MIVETVHRQEGTDGKVTQEDVKLRAVYAGETNAEDNTFAEATPSADFSMTVNNPAVIGQLKEGQAFYVDLTPVEAAE